jgi:hypothetical protein
MSDPQPVLPPRTPAAESLHLNAFPVRVQIGDETYDKALVRTEGDDVEVWVENAKYPHDPIRVFLEQIETVHNNTMSQRYPVNKQAIDIETPSGATLHVQKQGGCGCGSKLRTVPRRNPNGGVDQSDVLSASIAAHFPGAQI